MGIVTGADRLDTCRWAVPAAMAMKAALTLAFVVALTVPLDQLEGKGMAFRFPLFMLSAAVVPLVWRRRFSPYPATADVLVVAPFLLDTLGNLVGLYDAYDATDDVMHALNWVLLVAAFHALRFRSGGSARTVSPADAWLLGAGIGALAIVGWEIAEWIVAETGAGGGLALTYGDTVGDLALSTAGGMVGSWLGVRFLGDRSQQSGRARLS